MKISKKLMLPMAAIALVGAAAAFGAHAASADTSGTDPQASLVQKIADTFKVDKSKVQAVFDQDRADRQAEMEKRADDRLAQAVTDGKLTAAQKTAIETERKKLKAEMEATKDKTGDDRRTAMKQVMTEAQDWAKANNIDAKWLMAGPGGHMHGMRGGMGHGMGSDDMGPGQPGDDGATPSPSPAS